MKALARYGKEFGGYRMIDVPEPECGPEDIIIEIKAAAICGADMKHYKVDNGSDEFNSIRGHEFAGEIVEGRRASERTGRSDSGLCPTTAPTYAASARHANRATSSAARSKVNLGLDNNTWGGGFSKYCKVPGEILRIHKHAIWEIPENVKYEEAAVLDPICNSYKAIAQQGPSPSGTGRRSIRDRTARVVRSTGSKDHGRGQHRNGRPGRGCTEVRFPVAKELGATHCGKRIQRRCREEMYRDLRKRQLWGWS